MYLSLLNLSLFCPCVWLKLKCFIPCLLPTSWISSIELLLIHILSAFKSRLQSSQKKTVYVYFDSFRLRFITILWWFIVCCCCSLCSRSVGRGSGMAGVAGARLGRSTSQWQHVDHAPHAVLPDKNSQRNENTWHDLCTSVIYQRKFHRGNSEIQKVSSLSNQRSMCPVDTWVKRSSGHILTNPKIVTGRK